MQKKKSIVKKYGLVICSITILIIIIFIGISIVNKEDHELEYGVFLNLDASDMDRIEGYQTLVIDAQYFSKEDIMHLKEQGSTVYSYLNVGSIENFRTYYDAYSYLALGAYENWDEEQWIDVSSPVWQEFLVSLEEELLAKGIDGFFIDNCDVYYQYHTEDIFEGLTLILEHLMKYDISVIINGGDTYVMEFMDMHSSAHQIMTGVNQESVWGEFDFETGNYIAQSKDNREYFESYVEACRDDGADVYLLEYTTDFALKWKIKKYCANNQFHYYISDSIELD